MTTEAFSPELLHKMDAYWRAANYLSVGQLYLCNNPLLREPLKLSHVKLMLIGHWGMASEQNFIYVHLNRVIKKYDLDMIYASGPGHGGPAIVSNIYLEGTYSEVYLNISQDEAGLRKLFKQFSFPGGIPSHVSPECPGSTHEWGELGYSLSHAFGAVFDNPELIVACVIGDGEAETGLLTTAWHTNKFLNPITDGAVLPWRRKFTSLNYLRASHVWQQMHNSLTHQNPGFKEEGVITTPFDMTVLNDLDRFHFVMGVIDGLPQTGDRGIYLKQQLQDKLIGHKQYIDKHGQNMPEIRNWTWGTNE